MLTLRQIEVLRAIMVTGSVAGAAKLLNVSAPGISRLMKFTEDTLKVPLFNRRHGRYVPTPESRNIFDLLDGIHRKLEDLQSAVDRLGSGAGRELSVALVPNVATGSIPRAVQHVKARFPQITLAVDVVTSSETVDYLLLGRGEVVATFERLDHSIIDFVQVATSRLVCLAPMEGDFALQGEVTPEEIARHPLVGVDPSEPYGRSMTEMFRREDLQFGMSVHTRLGGTVAGLVAAGLGLAVLDEFALTAGEAAGCRRLPIRTETSLPIYAAFRSDTALSAYAESFIDFLRNELGDASRGSAEASGATKT